MSPFRSIWTWICSATLILLWLPLLALVRLFDRDPAHYRTGFWFRRLGRVLTSANPSWRVHISGRTITDPRRPYVVVSNHQSFADIPIISNLAWEMKWMAKTEMFKVPIVGWMLRLAGDIEVDRNDRRSGGRALLVAAEYLRQRCSVMIFPEGTRSPDARVGAFNDGAFRLAIRESAAILPLAVDGSHDCLPKRSWRFGPPRDIHVGVLEPVETASISDQQVNELKDRVRQAIILQIAEWRGVQPADVDGALHHNRERLPVNS